MATEVKIVANTVRELLAMGEVDNAIDLLIASGHGHHVTIGTLTSPIVGGGNGTGITIDQPEGVISIGSNQAMIPLRVAVQCEVGLIAADSEVDEILIAVDRASAVGGINLTTLVLESVFNMRTDLGDAIGSEVTAISAATAGITSPTLGLELDRAQRFRDVQGTPANALGTQFSLLYEPKHPPILVGSSAGLAMYLYWGGTVAVSGFAQIQVVVFPAAWVKGLTT